MGRPLSTWPPRPEVDRLQGTTVSIKREIPNTGQCTPQCTGVLCPDSSLEFLELPSAHQKSVFTTMSKPIPAPERKSRIGALKQQLVQSDQDMAKLEDHIRGLLIKSKGNFNAKEQGHFLTRGLSPRLSPPVTSARRHANANIPQNSSEDEGARSGVPDLNPGSPWAVLQVSDEAAELREQLESTWRESERAKSQLLADKLTIQDLRQKLLDATRHEKHGSELETKLHFATESSSDKDRMIRLLESEVAELKNLTANVTTDSQTFRLAQIELLERQNKALENETEVLKRQLALSQDSLVADDEIAEARAKLHVAKLKMDADMRAAKDRIANLEIEVNEYKDREASSSKLAAGWCPPRIRYSPRRTERGGTCKCCRRSGGRRRSRARGRGSSG